MPLAYQPSILLRRVLSHINLCSTEKKIGSIWLTCWVKCLLSEKISTYYRESNWPTFRL